MQERQWGCVSLAEGADSRVESGRNKVGSKFEVGFSDIKARMEEERDLFFS